MGLYQSEMTKIVDEAGNELVVEADGSINVNASITLGETEITNDVGNPIPVTGSVTITDGSGPVTVDGSVSVSNFPASTEISNDVGNPVPVNGTVAVSNPGLTDAQLRATPVPVSGTVTITDGAGPVTVDGTVGVSGSVAVTGPLTDTQLRATPVPVSGTVTITDGAGPVTVDGTVTAAEAKAEDAVAASGDNGIPILGVRNDADAVRTSADGDYGMIALDSAGRVKTSRGTAPSVATTTSVPVNNTVDTLLAANAARKMATFQNTGSTEIYLRLGAAASTALYTVRISGNSYYELPLTEAGVYTGIVTAVTTLAGNTNVMVTEM